MGPISKILKTQATKMQSKTSPPPPKKKTTQTTTLPETNIAPENQWLEDVFPTEIVPFLGDMLVFGGL